VLCYRALPLRAQTLSELKRDPEAQNVAFVCYNNDNAFGSIGSKVYWRLFKQAIPYYDLHLVYRDADVLSLGGSVRSYVLRSHYLPWLHRRLDSKQITQKSSDICFLGHFEPDRRANELDLLMKQVPATYSIRGSGWAKHGHKRAWASLDTAELQGEEYVEALNATKIALVFFSAWNSDTYTRRVFEIPACGTFMLSQRTDTMRSLYAEDKEAVYFSSPDELVDKARYYLKHDAQRKRIAEAGRARCIKSGYDIFSRMNEWLKKLNTVQ
jgi:spore maturation protein CgeB